MSLRISKNKLAEKIVGKRDLPPNTIIFDEPCELGYHCPVEYSGQRNGKINRICDICGELFFIYKSQFNKPGENVGRFCSKKCKGLWMSKQKLSETHKQKIGKSHLSEKNSMWKGDNVGISSLHEWVTSRLLKPELCEICGKKPSYDLSNKTGIYNRNLVNWWWLCRSCHMKWDYANGFRKKSRHNLQWSEYNGFIYCDTCNKDYPSALCMPDIDRAIKTYLNCVLDAKNLTLK